MMFTAASYMVEVLSGDQFGEFLRKRIWEPLRVLNTYHDISGVEAGEATALLAHGYEWNEGTKGLVEIPFVAQSEGQGAGLVFTSVEDYARWTQSLIKRSGPLPVAAHKELVKPRTIMDEEGTEMPFHSQSLYALGLGTDSYRGRTVVGHGGSVPGFRSLMRYLPELEWGVVVFGNSGGAQYLAKVLYMHLVDELLEIPKPERLDWWKIQEESRQEEDCQLESKLAKPGTEMSVPLLEYAGNYHNSGYHGIVIEVKDGKLMSDCTDRTFGFTLTFHVSGDGFVAEMRDMFDGSKRNVEAKFEIGPDRVVKALGVELEEDMKSELIWFARVE
jgi:CubicO group peptidase (beta-lactamase class C family)